MITQVKMVVMKEFLASLITFFRIFKRAKDCNSPHRSVSPVLHSSGQKLISCISSILNSQGLSETLPPEQYSLSTHIFSSMCHFSGTDRIDLSYPSFYQSGIYSHSSSASTSSLSEILYDCTYCLSFSNHPFSVIQSSSPVLPQKLIFSKELGSLLHLLLPNQKSSLRPDNPVQFQPS